MHKPTKIHLFEGGVALPEEIPEQYYDLNDNQMPYGGATDIHGKILWKVSKEEHDQMMARIKKAFEKE